MLQGKTDSMVSISSGAIITALGAIGPPNIVDLPEFAPVFPTTALFGWAFRCFERLECRAHLPGDSRTPSEEILRPCFRKGIFELGGCVARVLVPSVQGGRCAAASHSHMWLLSRGAGKHLQCDMFLS